jgi:membrane fusion protein, multidrug efflux system
MRTTQQFRSRTYIILFSGHTMKSSFLSTRSATAISVVPALVLCALLTGCGKGPGGKPEDKATAPAQAMLLTPEDLITLGTSSVASGPIITGSVQPERRADLRAEVSAVVLQVARENGETVRRGDLLVRLDDTSIRDALASAEAAVRASAQAFEQAERQFQRMKTLRASGMASVQQLDDAEVRRNNAQSDAEAAKTRAVQARQQLARTEVRAPFDGIVSDRKVSAGDTAQIGKELVKVIDPASLRLEGMVSADHIGSVKSGQTVAFHVNGYGNEEFLGKVKRVNPSANVTTRQVEVLVDFADKKQPKLAGLYAEGRVETDSAASLTIPPTALIRDGDRAMAWRVKDNTLQKVNVAVGERDPRSGNFIVKSGLADGDKLLRYPSAALKEGQKIQIASVKPSVPAGADKPTAEQPAKTDKPAASDKPADTDAKSAKTAKS